MNLDSFIAVFQNWKEFLIPVSIFLNILKSRKGFDTLESSFRLDGKDYTDLWASWIILSPLRINFKLFDMLF